MNRPQRPPKDIALTTGDSLIDSVGKRIPLTAGQAGAVLDFRYCPLKVFAGPDGRAVRHTP